MLATAPPRASHPSAATDPDRPLVVTTGGRPAVTIVLATRPGPALRGSDRRRLAARIQGVQRRLRHRGLSADDRRRVTAHLVALANAARQVPVGDGLALVASSDDACLLHLRHPVRGRVLIGPPPTRVDVAEAAITADPVAVLNLSLERARLLIASGGVLRDAVGGALPMSRHHCGTQPLLLPDYLGLVDAAVAAELPPATPLVVAGDERLAAAFAERCPTGRRVAAVVAGDHRTTSPMALLALARQRLDRALTVGQRRALGEVAVAADDGRLVAGVDETGRRAAGADGALLVVERRVEGELAAARDAVAAGGGRVVVVPDGRLASHGGAALVP